MGISESVEEYMLVYVTLGMKNNDSHVSDNDIAFLAVNIF